MKIPHRNGATPTLLTRIQMVEFERLWTETRTPPNEIVAILRTNATVEQLADMASRRGMTRMTDKAMKSAQAKWEAAAVRRIERKPEPEKVSRVAPNSYPNAGFSMISGRIK